MNNHERYFLIDYENVGISGLAGIERLTTDDQIIIFYSDKAQSITFELYEKLQSSAAEIDLVKVNNGEKNALDFQLSSVLGYMLCENQQLKNPENTEYHIISHDKGYNSMCNYWSGRGCPVDTCPDLFAASSVSAFSQDEAEARPKRSKAADNRKATKKTAKMPEKLRSPKNIERNLRQAEPEADLLGEIRSRISDPTISHTIYIAVQNGKRGQVLLDYIKKKCCDGSQAKAQDLYNRVKPLL